LFQTVEEWAFGEPEGLTETKHSISWNTEREAYMNLTDYIFENSDIVESELKQLGTVQHNITFAIEELLESLKPPSQVSLEKKSVSTSATATPPYSRGGSANKPGTSREGIFRRKKKEKNKDKEPKDKDKEKEPKEKDKTKAPK